MRTLTKYAKKAAIGLFEIHDNRIFAQNCNSYLTFHKHMSAVARSCNSLAQAIRHIRHWLTTELALACSLIPSRIDYCNAVLHGAPSYSIRSCSKYRTTQLGSFSRLQDDPITPARC